MTLEAKLDEQTEVLKGIHTLLATFLQTLSAQPAATANTADTTAAPEKKTRTTKKTETTPVIGLVDGDPEGTRYFVSESLGQAYAQKPGDPDPQDASFKIETAEHYLAKKAEFAAKKPQPDAAAQAQPATSEPSATAQADTASGDVTFKQVTDALMALNKKLSATDPTAGRAAILSVLKEFGCEGKTVPALEAMGKNAEILARVNEIANPSSGVDDLGL